ncbi:MAG: EamA family transporter [Clostridiales bacterium]|nr:EamA family transporter [Clostridiales bacterium]
MLYLALISAVAYTVWSLLLRYNPVSKVAVMGFTNPIFGVLLSALILGEASEAFSIKNLFSSNCNSKLQ